MTKEDLRAKVIAKAWKDPAFKKKLLSNPRSTLKEMGIIVAENMEITIIEDDAQAFTFVLPPAPAKMQQMSDAEIRQLAAAGSTHSHSLGFPAPAGVGCGSMLERRYDA